MVFTVGFRETSTVDGKYISNPYGGPKTKSKQYIKQCSEQKKSTYSIISL